MCAQTFNFCQSIHKFWPTTQHRALVGSSWMKYILVKKKVREEKVQISFRIDWDYIQTQFPRGWPVIQWNMDQAFFCARKDCFSRSKSGENLIWGLPCEGCDTQRAIYGLNQTKLFGPNTITTGFAHKVALRQFVNIYCAERWKTLWPGFRSICICKNACLSIINKFML